MKKNTGYFLAVILFIINIGLWALATGGIDVWNYPSSEGKNFFVLWVGISLILPIVAQVIINSEETDK